MVAIAPSRCEQVENVSCAARKKSRSDDFLVNYEVLITLSSEVRVMFALITYAR